MYVEKAGAIVKRYAHLEPAALQAVKDFLLDEECELREQNVLAQGITDPEFRAEVIEDNRLDLVLIKRQQWAVDALIAKKLPIASR